jgi:2'-5' RNA ligase
VTTDVERFVEDWRGVVFVDTKDVAEGIAAARRLVESLPRPRTVFPITKAADGHSGLFVALYPSAELQRSLAIPGGEEAKDLHVTLAYVPLDAPIGDKVTIAAALRSVAANLPPLEGSLAGWGRFLASKGSDGKDVLFLTPDVKGLVDARHMVAAVLEGIGLDPNAGEHGWTPHLTLAYLAPGLPESEIPPLPELPRPIAFDELTVGWGDGTYGRWPLRGRVEKINPHHDSLGRFAGKDGGGVSGATATEMDAHYGEWSGSITTDQRQAIGEYVGGAQKQINRMLRAGTDLKPPQLADRARLVREALLSAPETPRAMVVHRYVGKSADALKGHEGDLWVEKGFMSTTITEGSFGDPGVGNVLHITVPKGSKAGWMAGMSGYPDEHELLFPPGSVLRIGRSEGNAVHLELVGQ